MLKGPGQYRNSPISELVPGKPKERPGRKKPKVTNQGMYLPTPVAVANSRLWVRSSSTPEECPGGYPVVDHLQHGPFQPRILRTKMPRVTKPLRPTEE